MSEYSQASKEDRLKIRREMLKQAEGILAGLYASKAQLKFAARQFVDRALARERRIEGEDNGEVDDSSAESDSIQ